MPNWLVSHNSGHYTIRIGLVNASGQTVASAYVHRFGHPNLDGDSAYCSS